MDRLIDTMDGDETSDRLSPDDAFAVLGNEIRVGILQALGDAEEPLAFSALYDRLPIDDSARFNYHLGELRGHFVRKTDAGYALDHPGRRVVEAILSGTVTDDPDLDRTAVDDRCPTCERQLSIQWRDGSVELFCSTCESRWTKSGGRVGESAVTEPGYLGRLPLPPAGLANRTPDEVLRVAYTWSNLELLAVGSGVCPRCAATVDTALSVCPDHKEGGGCSNCNSRVAALLTASCTNCIYKIGCAAAMGLLSSSTLLGFMFEHGLDPFSPRSVHRLDRFLNEYDEAVRSVDPPRVALTFSIDGDDLTLHVDENGDLLAEST